MQKYTYFNEKLELQENKECGEEWMDSYFDK